MSGSTTGSRSSSSEDANKNSNTGGNSNRNNKRPLLLLTDGTVDWLAGWVSGAASVWVCQPVDTVLTRWQAAATSAPPIVASNSVTIGSSGGSRSIKTALHCGGPLHSYTSTSSVSLPSSGGSSSGWRAVAVDLVQTAGWRSLWRGASPMITVVPLQNGLLMGGYGWGTRYFYCNTSTRIETERNNNAVVGVKNSMLSSRTKQLCAIFVGGCTGGTVRS